MIPVDFIYENEWLSAYDLVTLEPKDGQKFVTRNIDKSEISSIRPSPLHYGTTYSDVLTLNFFIGRYINYDIVSLNEEEINDVRSWLESPKTPKKLIVLTTESEEDTIVFYGLFTDIQPYIVSGKYYGLYLTFMCDSPYGYTEDNNVEFEFGNKNKVEGFYYNTSAERYEYLLPKIVIESKSIFGQNEKLYIQNVSDNNKIMSITLPQGKSKLVIDCKEKTIVDENDSLLKLSDIGVVINNNSSSFINSFSYYWLSLVYGINNLTFTATVGHTIDKVVISAKFIIKLGGF